MAQLLDSPEQIWLHAFERQICEASRSLLVTISSLGGSCDFVDLEPAWDALHKHRANKYNFATTARDFRRSLDELEGSFLHLKSGRAEFLNPSIRDFMAGLIGNNVEFIRDILSAAIRFKQVMGLRDLAKERPSDLVAAHALKETADFLSAIERVLYAPDMRWERTTDGIHRGSYIDTSETSRLCILIQWAESEHSEGVMGLLVKMFGHALSIHSSVDIVSMIPVLKAFDNAPWVYARGGTQLRRQYLDLLLSELKFARHFEWNAVLEYQRTCAFWAQTDSDAVRIALDQYQKKWIDDERFDCDSISELEGLRDGLKKMQDTFGLSLATQIGMVELDIAERAENTEEDGGYRHVRPASVIHEPDVLNEEHIRHLFMTLVEQSD